MNIKIHTVLSLSILVILAVVKYGVWSILPQVVIATTSAILIDEFFWIIRKKKLSFSDPSSAAISGLILALLLPKNQVWIVPLLGSILAILSKNLIRYRGKNIFNPAGLSVLLLTFIFPADLYLSHPKYLGIVGMHLAGTYFQDPSFLLFLPHGWIGSLSPLALIFLGIPVAWRMRKLTLTGSFLLTYTLLFAGFALLTVQDVGGRILMEILFSGILFLSFFMLTDPATDVRSGVLLGILSFILRFLASPVNFLLLGLIIMNLVSRLR